MRGVAAGDREGGPVPLLPPLPPTEKATGLIIGAAEGIVGSGVGSGRVFPPSAGLCDSLSEVFV